MKTKSEYVCRLNMQKNPVAAGTLNFYFYSAAAAAAAAATGIPMTVNSGGGDSTRIPRTGLCVSCMFAGLTITTTRSTSGVGVTPHNMPHNALCTTLIQWSIIVILQNKTKRTQMIHIPTMFIARNNGKRQTITQFSVFVRNGLSSAI